MVLKNKYAADFIVFDQIVLEVKATSLLVDNFVVQTINYLKASGLQLGIISNFDKSLWLIKELSSK